jgi:hypothetical protein
MVGTVWGDTMRVPLHWTALLLGVLAMAPVAAEAALRLYASYVWATEPTKSTWLSAIGKTF